MEQEGGIPVNGFGITPEIIVLLLPLAAVQLGLAAYCWVKIFKEGVENLTTWAWLAICLLVNLLGPIAFLLLGRRKEYR